MHSMHATRFHPRRAALAIGIAAALAACSPPTEPPELGNRASAAATQRGTVAGERSLPDFTALVEKQGPAVVNIITSQGPPAGTAEEGGSDPLLEFFRRFMPDHSMEGEPEQPLEGMPQQPQRGLGSGFIISPDGVILTNAHVVAGAQSVIIRLADGKREFRGKVLGIDRRSDVAVVKIEAEGLPVASLGSSASVKPGQWVATIGSPFGFSNSVTAGIVSATRRTLPNDSFVPFIQTDVAVNPGNSGGPLLDVDGKVIGVNSMIYSQTGGYMGVSFAIPIEVALDVARKLQTDGKVTRGRLGVAVQPLTAELARAFKQETPAGVLIGAVEPGGPAEKAGLKSGDVILTYNGQAVNDASELPRLVAATPPGSPVRMDIWRDRERHRIDATVGEMPAEPDGTVPASLEEGPRGAEAQEMSGPKLALRELPAEHRQELGIDYGLMVESVSTTGNQAADATLRPGDVIVGVNQERFANREEFDRLMTKEDADDPVALLVRRGKASLYVALDPHATAKVGAS